MQILFLDPVKQYPTNKRVYEWQDAAARSHAAKFAHRRLKKSLKICTRQTSPSSRDLLADELSPPALYPTFGAFRSEVMSLLPNNACRGDSQALDFFVEVTMPGIDVANEVFDSLGVFHFMLPNLVGHLLPQQLQNARYVPYECEMLINKQITPVSYHAIMALIHLTGSLHRQPDVKASPLMLEHRGKAMNKLRALLDQGEVSVSEALILAIISLATVDGVLGNFGSYRTHLSALQLLERQRGYLKLSPHRRVGDIVALYSDTFNALETGKSAFERRRYKATHSIRTLPTQTPKGFVNLLQQTTISDDTVSVIITICNLGLATPCVTLSHSQKMSLANRRGTVRKYRNYLDSVPIFFIPDSPTTSPDIFFEKMLVLALSLFAWCGFSTIRSPQFAMYKAMIKQLTNRLVVFQPETAIKQRCAAWMWLMVIDAWRVGGSSNGVVLLQGVDMLWQFNDRFPEYRSWTKVQALTRLFLWTGDMETFWSQKWEALSARNLE